MVIYLLSIINKTFQLSRFKANWATTIPSSTAPRVTTLGTLTSRRAKATTCWRRSWRFTGRRSRDNHLQRLVSFRIRNLGVSQDQKSTPSIGKNTYLCATVGPKPFTLFGSLNVLSSIFDISEVHNPGNFDMRYVKLNISAQVPQASCVIHKCSLCCSLQHLLTIK